jgi:hypothetical protein
MKRSEAIRLIYDVLTENEKYDNVSTSRELLGKLEEAGMLPPLNKWEDYLWEPEDD